SHKPALRTLDLSAGAPLAPGGLTRTTTPGSRSGPTLISPASLGQIPLTFPLEEAPVDLRLLLVLSSAALALWAPATRSETSRFSLDLARRIVSVSSPRTSPDGKLAAFVVTRPNYADN